MSFNYLDKDSKIIVLNNKRRVYGNSLNTQILDWTTDGNDNENKRPNILHLLNEGENVWTFRRKNWLNIPEEIIYLDSLLNLVILNKK